MVGKWILVRTQVLTNRSCFRQLIYVPLRDSLLIPLSEGAFMDIWNCLTTNLTWVATGSVNPDLTRQDPSKPVAQDVMTFGRMAQLGHRGLHRHNARI